MVGFLKQIKRIMLFCFVSVLLLSGFNASATECGVFQLRSNRSSGISVKSNKCDELPYISKGTVFDLAAKGRLWLKSGASENKKNNFQMICQNRTGQVIQLELSGSLTPWLSLTELKNCSGWVDNKLSCDGTQGEKRGLYCASAFIKNATNHIQRTSSVKMRDLDQLAGIDSYFDKQQLLELFKPELKLCKQANGILQEISIVWVVQMATVKMFEVMSPKLKHNDELSACVKAVISTVPYPMFSRKERFSSIF